MNTKRVTKEGFWRASNTKDVKSENVVIGTKSLWYTTEESLPIVKRQIGLCMSLQQK